MKLLVYLEIVLEQSSSLIIKKIVSSCNQATITYINNITIYEECIKGYKRLRS